MTPASEPIRLTLHPYRPLLAVTLGFLALAGIQARADWPGNNTNLTKWAQFPDRWAGFDVLAGQPPTATGGPAQAIILADDFKCTVTGPITDLHLWTSWLGMVSETAASPPRIPITLGIWTDEPSATNADGIVTPSQPGKQLWSQTFAPGQYYVRPWSSAQEQFWSPDPAPQGTILGQDHLIWQYNFYPDAAKAFTQTGSLSAPVIYWLSMTAGAATSQTGRFFGWKTSTNQLLDNAVFGHLNADGFPVGDWQELLAPTTPKRSLDFAFAVTTRETGPPPQFTNKWVQYPQLIRGLDIQASAPYLAADDFSCTNASPITNLQLWGSWRQDLPEPNARFVLSIWSDAPAGAGNSFSYPGRLLWSESYVPGEYLATSVAKGQEQFYDPSTGELSSETQVWLYSFTPKKPFCQKGSIQSPVTYWLSATAITPDGSDAFFGWKTSTNHWHDDAVFGQPDANGNPVWKELFDPTTPAAPVSLDLAFLLNNGPPSPDCEPTMHRKWLQAPDVSSNGLDVLDTWPEVLGDDFRCKVTGPLSRITLWGSWLGDRVDTNAVFQVSLWTDATATQATNGFSSPGSLLCRDTFYSPQTVGTSIQRYEYSLFNSNVTEQFFNPDLPAAKGFVGADTQIWQYDFYPFQSPKGCWRQYGSTFSAQGQVLWVVVSYLPPAGGAAKLFGWKTSTTHKMDDAVFGHLNNDYNPLNDWKDLRDPRAGQSLDLSFALWEFPVTAVHKQLRNTTSLPATGIQWIVAGDHIVTWHYDGAPPWPNFQANRSGGNTILQWSGQTVAPGALTQVGFEMGSPARPATVALNWMSGATVVQPPIPQANFYWLNSGLSLVVVNDIARAPRTTLSSIRRPSRWAN